MEELDSASPASRLWPQDDTHADVDGDVADAAGAHTELKSLEVVSKAFTLGYDFIAPSSVLKHMFLGSLGTSPLSLVVHNIGGTLVVDDDVDSLLRTDMLGHTHAHHLVASIQQPTNVLADVTLSITDVPERPVSPSAAEPLLLLTNHSATAPFPLSTLQRNRDLHAEVELCMQLSSACLPADVLDVPAAEACVDESLPPRIRAKSARDATISLPIVAHDDDVIHVNIGDASFCTVMHDAAASARATPSVGTDALVTRVRDPELSALSNLSSLCLWLNSTMPSGISSPVASASSTELTVAPMYPSDSMRVVASTVNTLLSFLKTHCTSGDSTYWVCTDPRDGSVRLFTFTRVRSSSSDEPRPEHEPATIESNTPLPSFCKPVAQLCFRAAERVFSNRYRLTSASKASTVMDAVDAAVESYDALLCSQLYTRAAQLLSFPEDVVLWCTVQGRLASIVLPGHAHLTSPKQSFATQDWLSIDFSSASSFVDGNAAASSHLLDEEQLSLDAVRSALPTLLFALHTLTQWLHLHHSSTADGCNTSAMIDVNARRVNGQLRSTACNCVVVIAKLAMLQGQFGRALRLCEFALQLVPDDKQWGPSSIWCCELRCEVFTVVGRTLALIGRQVQTLSSSDATSLLQRVGSQFASTTSIMPAAQSISTTFQPMQWLQCADAIKSLSISSCVTSEIIRSLMTQHGKYAGGLYHLPDACAASHTPVPDAAHTRTIELSKFPLFSGAALVSSDQALRAAIQAFVGVLSAPMHVDMLAFGWRTQALTWLFETYSDIGEVFMKHGRVTKAIQHFHEGATLFTSLHIPHAAALCRLRASRLVHPVICMMLPSSFDESNPELVGSALLNTSALVKEFTEVNKESNTSTTLSSLVEQQCINMCAELHMGLVHLFRCVQHHAVGCLAIVQTQSSLDKRALTLLSSWFSVATCLSSDASTHQRHVSSRTLASVEFWNGCASDALDCATTHARSAADMFAAMNSVTRACDALALLGRLQVLQVQYQVSVGGSGRFMMLQDLISHTVERMNALNCDHDTVLQLRRSAHECAIWRLLYEQASPDDGAHSSILQRMLTRCVPACISPLQQLCIPVKTSVDMPGYYEWTQIREDALFAMKCLAKHDPKMKTAYACLLLNSDNRELAWGLLEDAQRILAQHTV